ncbi:MAG: flagellar protein FlgN [Tepidanaerobacteraceae bacterium]|jgi:hypothetical protein
MSSTDENEIYGLMQKKLDCLKTILGHTATVSELLDLGDTGGLEVTLDMRQREIDESDKIDRELSVLHNRDLNVFIKNMAGRRDRLGHIYEEIVTCLNEISQLENENICKAGKLMVQISDYISKLKQTSNAMKGYGIIGSHPNDGAFIDTKK